MHNTREKLKGMKRENLSPSLNLNPKWVTTVQRNKSCFKGPPLIARNILEKEKKDGKPERALNLEKPSLTSK